MATYPGCFIKLIIFRVIIMDSSLFKYFLFAIIVQCCLTSESNASQTPLKDIIEEQQAQSDLEKLQQQQQRESASYADKAKTMASKGLESKATSSKVAKEAAKLKIDEATTAVEDSNRAEGSKNKKELNKGKEKVEDHKFKTIEDELDGKTGVSVEHRDGNIRIDLIQPLDMKSDNRFKELIITEENLPKVQISTTKTTNFDDTVGTGYAGLIKREGKGRRRKKKQQKNVESSGSGDLIGSGSVIQNENENDDYDYNSYAKEPIILTEERFQKFKAAFEPFFAGQESYLKKDLARLNHGKILHNSDEQLVAGMSKEKHDGNWHKAVRKVLVTIMEGAHKFWRQNVAQIVSEEPSNLFKFYLTMTAIYLGPKEGRSAEVKKMIPRVNAFSMLVYKAFVIHNKKSVDLFMDAVKVFTDKIYAFQPKFERIRTNENLKVEKRKEKIANELGPVTTFYKQNFVEKFYEYFHVALLMQNEMQKDGAKLYENFMRLANEQSAQLISHYMTTLFQNVECGNFVANTMQVFNVYFEKAGRFPSFLDENEKRVALLELTRINILKRTNTRT